MNILLIGGTGYIGSHVYVELIQNGFNPIIYNRPSASSEQSLKRISQITGFTPHCIHGDMCDVAHLSDAMVKNGISLVIHFAALKSIPESINNPTLYYSNNFNGVLSTLKAMERSGCKKIIYSSSASIYALSNNSCLNESSPLSFSSPYANSKIFSEQAIKDWASSNPGLIYSILRYFNPVGAHPSGLIGEDPTRNRSNLISNLGRIVTENLKSIDVFGSDYDTPDGTCIRDFIHITDLSKAYLASINYLSTNSNSLTLNIGSGLGTSVLEAINAYKKVSGCDLIIKNVPRRIGDLSHVVADATLATDILGWKPSHNIEEMCKSDFLWQLNATKHQNRHLP